MKRSLLRLGSAVIISSCILLYLLRCINRSSLFGFELRTIHQVNNYAISINTQTPEKPLHHFTPESRNPTQNKNRANPVTKRPANGRKPVSCSGRYIYVHDLPSKFNDDLIKSCRKLNKWFDMCPYMVNSGLGPRIKDDTKRVLTGSGCWYNTNQFLLEVIFRERMKEYDCLTKDSSMASAIYVPFYTGFDISRHLWGFNLTIRDQLGIELGKWLVERPEWRRMKGRDHFFVGGRIGWDFRRDSDKESGWGNKLMRLPEFANTTMLTIETTNWVNEFSVPYPTYFHPSRKTQILDWQDRLRKKKRNHLFAFAGARRPSRNDSIRNELIDQCVSSPERCEFLDCKPPGIDCENPVKIMEFFQDSVFCLQPRGDSATRRSVFDSVLAGCIPVFFHPGTAYTQYTWYFPRNYTKFSVYIPEEDVKKQKADIGEILARVSEKEVSEMREEVLNMIPKTVYRKPGTKSDVFEDAFHIAVSRVLKRVRKVESDVKEGKDPKIYFSKKKDLNRLG